MTAAARSSMVFPLPRREHGGTLASLCTFVEVEGVEPINNLADRQVRPGVICRKTSFGTDSKEGSRFVERILTIVMSLRSQGRRILDFLARSLQAFSYGSNPPSLLPAQAAL